jgi:hypothetical protein
MFVQTANGTDWLLKQQTGQKISSNKQDGLFQKQQTRRKLISNDKQDNISRSKQGS